MPQTHILDTLRAAFPDPPARIAAYLAAYAALVHADRDSKRAALKANQEAWHALTEGERVEIDAALSVQPLWVQG